MKIINDIFLSIGVISLTNNWSTTKILILWVRFIFWAANGENCFIEETKKKVIKRSDYIKMIKFYFSNRWIVYRILLIILVVVASVKSRFSKLKSIKSCIWSIMLKEMLNGLNMMSIEKEVLRQIDYNSIIVDFLLKYCRRINLI